MANELKKITDLTAGTPIDTDVIPYVDLVTGTTKKALKSELDGDAATIAVGTVTTVSPATPADVTNVGTSSAAIFDFDIPQGATGATGDTGETGATGAIGIDWQGSWSAGTYTLRQAVEHNGSSWYVTAASTTEEPSISATDWDLIALKGTDGSGTVTSVDMSVPTGLTISGNPVTTSGTLAVGLDTGYVIPLQTTLDGFVTEDQTVAQSIGSTGSRLTKLWATDIESTNVPTVGGVALPTASSTTTFTGKTISVDDNTISGIAVSSFVLSNGSGNIDGSASQKVIPSGVVVGTTDTQTLTGKTIAYGSNTLTDVAGTSATQTLTNKRITVRSSTSASGDISPDVSATNLIQRTAVSGTIAINAPTGTPVLGDVIQLLIKDNGTSRTLNWNATYKAMGEALPTATTINKRLEAIACYDGTDWLTSVTQEV
jgi:hypothetical protein